MKIYESAYVAPLKSKPAAEPNHATIVQDNGEAGTSIEAEVPGIIDPAENNSSVEKPQHVFSTKCVPFRSH